MAGVNLTLGPILIGSFLNIMLWGVLIAQVIRYSIVHKRDKTWIKLMVAWLFLLDTLNSVFNIGFVYRYTVTFFGDFGALEHSHWLFHIAPFMTAIIASTTQGFFAWRITKLTGQAWMGWSIGASAFIQILVGLGSSIGSWIVVDFEKFHELNATIIMWLVLAATTDITITSVLIWYLRSHRTGFPHTDDVITKLIRSTVQTGLLTSLWAVGDLTFFLSSRRNNLHLFFDMPLSKLYSNSLMATLISRGGWDSGMTRVPAAGTTGSILVHVTTVRERELDRPIEKPKSHSQVPNDHVGQTTSGASRVFFFVWEV
ncbi:hypothetical protein FRC08_000736 [Ceratobasidium sp. 394]|nr:hypothetical protein FRC08_000736 [Ceratobasidium sp. 394]